MKRYLLPLSTVGAALLMLVSAGSSVSANPGDAAKKHGPIAWTESYDKAQKTAAKEKKIVMVDFWAEWCGPCKQMLGTTYQDKAVVTRAKQFVPVLIDIDKQPKLAGKYSVASIPTVIFLDSKGKVLARSEGYIDAPTFLKVMDEAKRKAK